MFRKYFLVFLISFIFTSLFAQQIPFGFFRMSGCDGTPWGSVTNGFTSTAYSTATPASTCAIVSQTRTCTAGTMSGTYTATSCTDGCTGTPWGAVSTGYSNSAYSSATPASTCAAASQTRTCTAGTMSGTYTITSCTDGCTGTPWGAVASGYSNTAYSSTSPASSCASAAQTRTCTAGSMSGTYTATTCTDGCIGTPWGAVASGYANTAYSSTAPASSCASAAQTRTCTAGAMSGTYTSTTCTDGCTGTPWGAVASGYSNTAYSTSSPAAACSTVAQTRTCTAGAMSGTYTLTTCADGCTGTPWGAVASGYSNTAYSSSTVTGPALCSSVAQTRTCTSGSLSGTFTNTSCTVTHPDCNLPWGGTIVHGATVTAYASSAPAGACSSEVRTCSDGTLSGSYTNQTCTAGCTGTLWGSVATGYSNTAYSSTAPASTCAAASQTRTCTAGVMSGTYTATTCTDGCIGTPWGSVANGYANTAYSSTAPASSCASASQTRTCSAGTLSGTYTATTCTDGCTGTPWGSVASGYANTAYSSSAPAATCASVAQTRTCSAGTMSGSYTITGCTNGCTGTPWGSVVTGYSGTAYSSTSVIGPATCSSEGRTCTNGTMSGSYGYTSCVVNHPGCNLPWGGSIADSLWVTGYLASAPAGACTSETRNCSNGTLSGSYAYQTCAAGGGGGACYCFDDVGTPETQCIDQGSTWFCPEQSYTTPGSYSFTVPAGVTLLNITVNGGGGGGSGYDNGSDGGSSSITYASGLKATAYGGTGSVRHSVGTDRGGDGVLGTQSIMVGYGGGGGANGDGDSGYGGNGGQVTGTLSVTAGQAVSIVVGDPGWSGQAATEGGDDGGPGSVVISW